MVVYVGCLSSENNPPHIVMHISKNESKASIKALYDTGDALNTDNLTYHKFINMLVPQ